MISFRAYTPQEPCQVGSTLLQNYSRGPCALAVLLCHRFLPHCPQHKRNAERPECYLPFPLEWRHRGEKCDLSTRDHGSALPGPHHVSLLWASLGGRTRWGSSAQSQAYIMLTRITVCHSTQVGIDPDLLWKALPEIVAWHSSQELVAAPIPPSLPPPQPGMWEWHSPGPWHSWCSSPHWLADCLPADLLFRVRGREMCLHDTHGTAAGGFRQQGDGRSQQGHGIAGRKPFRILPLLPVSRHALARGSSRSRSVSLVWRQTQSNWVILPPISCVPAGNRVVQQWGLVWKAPPDTHPYLTLLTAKPSHSCGAWGRTHILFHSGGAGGAGTPSWAPVPCLPSSPALLKDSNCNQQHVGVHGVRSLYTSSTFCSHPSPGWLRSTHCMFFSYSPKGWRVWMVTGTVGKAQPRRGQNPTAMALGRQQHKGRTKWQPGMLWPRPEVLGEQLQPVHAV